MESWHWFTLGIMVALTPSLIALAVLLRRKPTRDDDVWD